MPPIHLGGLRIRIIRGINLAIRDIRTSDPYIVLTMGNQKVQTRVIKRTTNPEWNEEFTFTISDPRIPINLTVYDHDRFSKDDAMGEAMVDIAPYMEALKLGSGLEELPVGTAVKKVQPNEENCLVDESKVVWVGKGKMVQEMRIRLKNVERGEVVVQIEWIDYSKSSATGSKRIFGFKG